MNNMKKYSAGVAMLDLPHKNLLYKRNLLSFKYQLKNIDIDLIYNSGLTADFGFGTGIKLSIQKKIVISNSVPTGIINENGRLIGLNGSNGVYVLDDGSGRVLRAYSTTYYLSDLSGNKEIYNSDGDIKYVYDRHSSTAILEFEYNDNGFDYVKCGTNRRIKLTHSGAQRVLSFLDLSGNVVCSTTLTRSSLMMTVAHYYGDTIVCSIGSGRNLTVQAKDSSFVVKEEITSVDSSGVVAITHKINNTTKSVTSYNVLLDGIGNKVKIIDIADMHGVKKRLEYVSDTNYYVYEIDNTDEDSTFVSSSRYGGEVSVFVGDNAIGTVGYTQGTALTKGTGVRWNVNATLLQGKHYIITGWIKPSQANIGPYLEVYGGGFLGLNTKTYIGDSPQGHWRFVMIDFVPTASAAGTYVYAANSDSQVASRDFMIFEGDKLFGAIEESLIISGTSHYLAEIYQYSYVKGGVTYTIDYKDEPLYLSDFINYLTNKKRSTNTGEVYSKNMKNVVAGASSFKVRFAGSNNFVGITTNTRCKQKIVLGDKKIETKYIFNLPAATMVQTIVTTVGSLLNTEQRYFDNLLDMIKTEKGDITYLCSKNTYGYNVSESYSTTDLQKYVSYDYFDTHALDGVTYGFTTKVTNENGEISWYYTDLIWGELVRVGLPNNRAKVIDYSTYHENVASVSFVGSDGTITNTMTYGDGYLSTAAQGSVEYEFSTSAGELNSISKNNEQIESLVYSSDFKTVESTHPTTNTASYKKTYVDDKYGFRTHIYKSTNTAFVDNTYSILSMIGSDDVLYATDKVLGNAMLSVMVDREADEQKEFGYQDKLLKKVVSYIYNSTTKYRKDEYVYDNQDRLTDANCAYEATIPNSVNLHVNYATETGVLRDDNTIAGTTCAINGTNYVSTSFSHDSLRRPTQKTSSMSGQSYVKEYTYFSQNGHTSDRLSNYKDKVNNVYKHDVSLTFGNDGLLSGMSDTQDANNLVSYVYDSFGRVVRENNKRLNSTIVYTYDVRGNITNVKSYSYTTGTPSGSYAEKTYSYDSTHKDRLTSFNSQSIVYDQQGCPTSYLGKTLTWSYGRLSNATIGTLATGKETHTYSYDAEGRVRKINTTFMPGQIIPYDYEVSTNRAYKYSHDGRLLYEYIKVTFESGDIVTISLVYLYDETGICGCKLTKNGSSNYYYYLKNAQGDVVEIYNSSGVCVVKYAYDAYGKCTTVSYTDADILSYNQIKYRGYYYDKCVNLYRLGSRFYDPNTGRFISPDTIDYLDTDSTHGVNLYAYCNDCPTMFADPSGHFPALLAFVLIGAAVGAASYVVSEAVSAAMSREWNWSWGQFIGSTLGGALGGLATGLGASPFWIGFIAGTSSTLIGMSLQNKMEDTNYSDAEILLRSLAHGIISGFVAKYGDSLFKINGLNAGRNSYAAISKQMATKTSKGIINNLAPKTISKILAYNLYGASYGMIFNSVNSEANIENYWFNRWFGW